MGRLPTSEAEQPLNDNFSKPRTFDLQTSVEFPWATSWFARTRHSSGPSIGATEMQYMALLMYQGRRDRDRFFEAGLFSDPAWDMLLAAYCLPTPARPLSVTALCHASGVPATTALRWIKHMCDIGLLSRSGSKEDGRVSFVALTEKGREQMEAHLGSILRRLAQTGRGS